MGNPFLDESAYLLALDPEEILEDRVVITIRNIGTIGEKLSSEHVEQRQVKSIDNSHPTPSVKTTYPTLQQERNQSSLSITS